MCVEMNTWEGGRGPHKHIWLHTSPDGAVKVFVDEINVWISGCWVEQITRSDVGGPHLISRRPWEKKRLISPDVKGVLPAAVPALPWAACPPARPANGRAGFYCLRWAWLSKVIFVIVDKLQTLEKDKETEEIHIYPDTTHLHVPHVPSSFL